MNILTCTIKTLLAGYPDLSELFDGAGLRVEAPDKTLEELIRSRPDTFYEEFGTSRAQLENAVITYIKQTDAMKSDRGARVQSITLIGGHDKSGSPENVRIDLIPGDIVCVVGPTGSGKSRLLADIECMAQGDTPTGRRIFINGEPPAEEIRYDMEHKLVAQLSQNMNFVMDLCVRDFLLLHAQSRLTEEPEKAVANILACANTLSGEAFAPDTPLTQLSGGQSRALMIASTALLSRSPIVLIDEIENAGVDRKNALNLLVRNEKIVLMSTHDPILALLGEKRIVIKNGGISAVIETGEEERRNLKLLEDVDAFFTGLRNDIRSGRRIRHDLKNRLAELVKEGER